MLNKQTLMVQAFNVIELNTVLINCAMSVLTTLTKKNDDLVRPLIKKSKLEKANVFNINMQNINDPIITW